MTRSNILKSALLAAVLLQVSFAAFAQKNRVREFDYYPRHEIYVQYGTPSIIELTTILNSEYKSSTLGIEADSRNYKFSGIAAIGYKFNLSPRVQIGIDGGYGYGSSDFYIDAMDGKDLGESLYVCRSSIMSYSGHVSGTFVYWTEGAMECSGSLYLGVCYMDESIVNPNTSGMDKHGLSMPETNDRLKFSYHITALKFRYGETFGGFAELGFGYRGLVNVGLSIKI